MLTLHLGVHDVPYAGKDGKTTHEVAEILEAKYHIMQTFFETHRTEIVAALADAMTGAVENLLMGHANSAGIYAPAESAINTMFQTFIDMKEMDSLGIAGVPTKASLKGTSIRFKDKRGAPGRPSFQDSGLYENHFVAWIEAS